MIREAAGAKPRVHRIVRRVYRRAVGEGKKSLAYAVVFRSPDKTLSADDSDAIRQAIVAKAADLGAQLRA